MKKTKLLVIALLILLSNVNGQGVGYPFLGKRYFINKNVPGDYFAVTINRQGKMQIDKYTNNQPETIYDDIYKQIVKDSYGSYSIENNRFAYQNAFDQGRVTIYYPDETKNAAEAERMKITDRTIKSYSGTYTFNEYLGQAHYSYLNDNDGGRVFTGVFLFNGNMADKLYVKIQGEFKDDYKNGTWSYNHILKKGLVTSLNETLTANYNSGVLSGLLTLHSNTTIHGKADNFNLLVSGTANVLDNHFIGQINYSRKVNDRSIGLKPLILKGQFNDEGFCDGAWSMIYQDQYGVKMYESRFNFINGVLVYFKNIDQQTGEVDNTSENPEYIEFAKQLKGGNNQATVNGDTKRWKVTSTGDERLLDVINAFCDPKLHLSPKGFIGVLPTFKTRVLEY